MRFVLDDRFGAGGTVYFIWIQWGAGEKGTAVFEMVFLRILSGASAFIVAGGPGDGNDVAAVWKHPALFMTIECSQSVHSIVSALHQDA